MNSIKIQIPYEYSLLDICEPQKRQDAGGLSDVFSNNKKYYTDITINLNHDEKCKVLCIKKFNYKDLLRYKWLIQRHYAINYYLDQLPARKTVRDVEKNFKARRHFYWGTPLGYLKNNSYYIYNHYNIIVELHENGDKYQVVGFFIEPESLTQSSQHDCIRNKAMKIMDDINVTQSVGNFNDSQIKINENPPMTSDDISQMLTETEIAFTYDVTFLPSNKTFASRWDYYLPHRKEMHWLGLVAANALIFIISFMVLYIFSRTIKKDIDIYNSKVIADDIIDEYGWKQVCNDVFRRPKHLFTLSAFVGTGMEIFILLVQFIYFSFIGLLSPESRGMLINIFVILFCLMGFFSGFFSIMVYKTNGGKQWLKCCVITALFFPGLIIITLFITRVMFLFERSSGGIHLSQIVLLVILWFCLSSPMVLFGTLVALRCKQIKYPCKVNSVPSKIESKPFYFSMKYAFFVTGIIPFATVFIEFIYIMAAMWRHQAHFLLSFIGFSTLCLVISSAEISIIFVYLNLCKGDYQWWWKSFFVGSSCSIYFLAYSIFYFFKINITRFTGMVVYFCVMTLISLGIGLVCGGTAVLATFGFLYLIYSKIKID